MHTPGPWTERHKGTIWGVYDSENYIIAHVIGGKNNQTLCANARLIAEAPEMLSLVRRIADRYEVEQHIGPDAWIAAGITHGEGQAARALLARLNLPTEANR